MDPELIRTLLKTGNWRLLASGLGAGPQAAAGLAGGFVRNAVEHPVETAVDFSPVGDVKALAYDAPRDFASGHPIMGLMSLASALPFVPSLRKFSSVDEATEALRRYAKEVDIGDNLDLASEINQALENTIGRYNAEPLDYVRVNNDLPYLGQYADGGVTFGQPTLGLEKYNEVMPSARAAEIAEEGQRGLVAESYRDIATHEVGHAMHDRMPGGYREWGLSDLGGERWYSVDTDPYYDALSISQLAARNTDETIAEAWTAFHRGEEISPKMKGLIQRIIEGVSR